MERASLTDVIQACQESSNYRDSRRNLPQSLPSRAFQMLDGAKKSLHRVSPHGSLDDVTCCFASDSDFFFNYRSRAREFNAEWVFEDLLLHEVELFPCWTL